MALRRNHRGEGEGAGDRASWNAGGGGTWPAAEHPIGAPVSPAATAELANVPASGGPDPAGPAWGDGLVDASALADMQAFNDLKAKRKKQKKRKIVTAVAVAAALIVAAGGVGFWYVSDQAARALQEAGMQFAPVEQGTFTQTVSASGNLRPVASVSATPEVDGIVGEVLVSEGDAVAAGQTLFTVVNAELDKAVTQAAQGIEEARNGVAQAQNAVNDAYRAKEQGRQAAADAQAAAAAMAAAGGEGGAGAAAAAGGQSFDEASADSAIRQAELSLNSANLGLQNAQAAYDEAVARAEKRTVTSSIAGSVVAVNIEPGKALGAAASGAGTGSPVQIADLSQMKVSIGVNEIDILKVSADQQATVTFTAAPDLQLPAKVVRIATTSSGSGDGAAVGAYGGSGAAVTYAVELLIEAPDPRLKPGMTAKATIVTQTIERALMVPISAVQTDGAGSYVMVLVDPETQETEMRAVETVASDGLTTVVKGDVKPGDSVVVGGGALGGMGAPLAGGGAASDASGAVVSGDSVVVG